jgi:hypothetical protein
MGIILYIGRKGKIDVQIFSRQNPARPAQRGEKPGKEKKISHSLQGCGIMCSAEHKKISDEYTGKPERFYREQGRALRCGRQRQIPSPHGRVFKR